MATDQADVRVLRLAEGFNALMEEYNQLLLRSKTLERSLLEAKSQFQHFIAERGTVSAEDVQGFEFREVPRDIENPPCRQAGNERWWMHSGLPMKKKSLLRTRYAVDAVQSLGMDKTSTDDATSKVSSEVFPNGGSSAMPSIVESPLEQDFTIPGTPSRLDCPFASMTTRRLSAHAASVVSRYKPSGIMTPRSSASRANGRVSTPKPSPLALNEDRPELCGAMNSPMKSPTDLAASIQGSGPVCPIRFLEKSSPEDVADYFEKHKHEIPRSHEICVKRYQSNAESIRQLDAKYGNLVSMIQGLGQKHAPMLPEKLEQDEETGQEAESTDRVRRWADDVSNVAQVHDQAVEDEERIPHFDRPMKDVRVGESPSRPWGIQVPISALEEAKVHDAEPKVRRQTEELQAKEKPDTTAQPVGKCPFAHGAPPGMINPHAANPETQPVTAVDNRPASPPRRSGHPQVSPVFIPKLENGDSTKGFPGMTFTGPVFIGYDPDQAAAVIRALRS